MALDWGRRRRFAGGESGSAYGPGSFTSSFCPIACRGLLLPPTLRALQTGWEGAIAGVAVAGAVIIFELQRVRALSLRRLIGAVVGSVLGIIGAALFCLVLRTAPISSANSAVLQIFRALLYDRRGPAGGREQGRLAESRRAGDCFLRR